MPEVCITLLPSKKPLDVHHGCLSYFFFNFLDSKPYIKWSCFPVTAGWTKDEHGTQPGLSIQWPRQVAWVRESVTVCNDRHRKAERTGITIWVAVKVWQDDWPLSCTVPGAASQSSSAANWDCV
jgi:hypothetical protein